MAGSGNVLKPKKQEPELEVEEAPEEEVAPVREKKQKVKKEKPAPPVNEPGPISNFIRDERTFKISGMLLIVVSVFLLIAFSSYFFTWKNDQSLVSGSWFDLIVHKGNKVDNWLGKFGAIISHQFMHMWFGIAAYTFVILSFIPGFKILFGIELLPFKKTLRYSFFSLLFIPAFCSYLAWNNPNLQFLGGGLGATINEALELSLGKVGAGLVLLFVGLAFAVAVFNFAFNLPSFLTKASEENEEDVAIEAVPTPVVAPVETGNKIKNEPKVELIDDTLDTVFQTEMQEDDLGDNFSDEEPIELEPIVEVKKPLTDDPLALEIAPVSEEKESDAAEGVHVVSDEETSLVEQLGEYDPTLDLSSYQYPTLDLLENYTSNRVQMSKEELMAELEANKKRIIETLGHYDIEIERIKATVGPTVTLFEIVPKAGIRISKIKNLEDDIALSLAALGIRIIAPIPGKGTIGIEVPNQNPDVVSMRSVMASEKFQNTDYDLPIALGKTISNEIFIADLAKMPHLLMAGATGQGKSVGLNAILVSLLYKKHPAQVKFVLVDPKKVELTLFKTIERHFLAKLPGDADAIITDTKLVVNTVNSLCVEMDNRYELLKEAQVRNIKEYNKKFIERKLNPNKGHRFLPYIVLVVDEFADLIMTAGKEIETPIARLAQLARAIGIHLIIATQRPSVNIITGTIKANFPARLAFKVTSKIDSRTILDTGGADQLIGRGDMLLSNGSDLIRVQCAFVDTPEVDAITSFIGNQRGYPNPYLLPEYSTDEGDTSGGRDMGGDDLDSMFEEAARMVVQFQQGSASLLQRRLKLGYNRAGRLVDQLEAAGIIGPFEGSKAREVRVKDMHHLEEILKNIRG
jgi:S-DNA-T family DNA segregation ATPase FtsK/SpoIIIE